jgi:hypothetical protein
LRCSIAHTFSLPRCELTQHLLESVQHGDLSLGMVQLEPFESGFDLV